MFAYILLKLVICFDWYFNYERYRDVQKRHIGPLIDVKSWDVIKKLIERGEVESLRKKNADKIFCNLRNPKEEGGIKITIEHLEEKLTNYIEWQHMKQAVPRELHDFDDRIQREIMEIKEKGKWIEKMMRFMRRRGYVLDLEPTVMDKVRSGPHQNLFHRKNNFNGKVDAANNFARGHHSNEMDKMAEERSNQEQHRNCFLRFSPAFGLDDSSLLLKTENFMVGKNSKTFFSTFLSLTPLFGV